MSATIFEAVRACSIALLAGAVLHADHVTAGNGMVVDWRTVKSGETMLDGADTFDTAHLFVALLGEEAAFAAATRDRDIAPPPPEPRPSLRIHAYAPGYDGGRRRAFDVGPFRVMVDPHEDDAAQAAFTEALAKMAAHLG